MLIVGGHVDLFATKTWPGRGATIEVFVVSSPADVLARPSYIPPRSVNTRLPRHIQRRASRQVRRRFHMSKHIVVLFLQVNTLLPIYRAPIRQLKRAIGGETYSFSLFLRDIDDTYTESPAVSYSLNRVDERQIAAAELNKVACRALYQRTTSLATKMTRLHISLHI